MTTRLAIVFASAVAVWASACGRTPCARTNVETADGWCVIPITCPEGSQPSLHHERCELLDGGLVVAGASGDAGARRAMTSGIERAAGRGGSRVPVAGSAGDAGHTGIGGDDADAGMSTMPNTMDAGRSGPHCGNGIVESGEACDGNCPSACPPAQGCLGSELQGKAADCTAKCVPLEITALMPGDGCCPMGADYATDTDCSPSCGDGVLTAPEKCEPGSADHPCPTMRDCDDSEPCTTDRVTGGQCSAECTHTRITQPVANDRCCPPGATIDNDSDCDAACGDGVVSAGEACDTMAPGSCPSASTCERLGSGCMRAHLSGSGCDARCEMETVTEHRDNDQCCPSGANASNDKDCKPVCGNGVREGAELCDGADCPTSCDDGNPCTTDELTGSATSCNAQCRHSGGGRMNACGGCGSLDHTPGSACTATQNSCTSQGEYECQGSDSVRCNAPPPAGSSEKCDNADNDCDGRIDEGVKNACGGCTALKAAVGATCLAEGPGCANQGKYECDGANALKCNAAPCLCGNGVVDSGESCDVSVPGGNPGSCPLSCNDNDPCTSDRKVGSLCQTACLYVPMSGCQPIAPPAAPENSD